MRFFRQNKTVSELLGTAELNGRNTVQEDNQITALTAESPTRSAISPNNKAERLMQLVGYAIDDWAKEFRLEKMPKKIIFEQALDAMRAMEIAWNSKTQ